MEQIVETGMKEGALGIGSSLIYAPADYANTNELITICKVATKFKGKYISHMRNEGRNVLKALDELITISKDANIPAEIYHLKASRKPNWFLLDSIINRVEKARENGAKTIPSPSNTQANTKTKPRIEGASAIPATDQALAMSYCGELACSGARTSR